MKPIYRYAILVLALLGARLWGGDVAFPAARQGLVTNSLPSDEWLRDFVGNGGTITYTARNLEGRWVLDGPFQAMNSNGLRMVQGNHRNGKWHGELLTFHPNGQLSSRERYEEGKSTGTGVVWSEEGVMLRTTQYANGEKHGAEVYWTSSGNMESRTEWKDGKPEILELFEGSQVKRRLRGEELKEYLLEKAMKNAKEMKGGSPAGRLKGDGSPM